MTKKKILLLLFSSILAVSVLVACGDKETSDAGEDNNNSNNNNSADEDKDKDEDKDIHIYLQSSHKPGMDMYVDEVSELSGFNLDIEFIVPEDYGEKLPVLFASGDLPDMIQTSNITDSKHEGALENGVFLELNDLLEEHGQNILENIPDEIWENAAVSEDGKIYGIPRLLAAPATMGTYIRKDWLDKLDMDVPETTDDWLAYFEAIKQQDMNGDGDADDEFGYLMMQQQGFNELFFGSFGVHPAGWHMTDGKMTPDMIQPEMKDAIAFYRDLYEKEYINPDFNTRTVQEWGTGFLEGKSGSVTMTIQGTKTYANPDEFDEEGVEVELVPPPVGPNGDAGLGLENLGLYDVFVIPAETENPEKVIQYVDWAWSSEEAETFFSFGIEGHNHQVVDGEIEFDENAPENTENFMRTLYATYMNPRGDSTLQDNVLEQGEIGELIINALEIAEEYVIQDDMVGMPRLKAYSSAPEIEPGIQDGTLFVEMFAKVVTGREDLDAAFDKFVSEWKKRGGEDAMEEATELYNEFN